MEQFVSLDRCPICSGNKFKDNLIVKDFTVSKLDFKIAQCETCGFNFTNPRPRNEDLGFYYKSNEYISHTDSKSSLFDKVYQLIKKYALVKKLQILMHYSGLKKGRVLDYGCGTGSLVEFYLKNGWDANGFEPDESARALASTKSPGKIFSSLDSIQNTYDAITMWHVLEHVDDLNKCIEFLLSKLDSKGVLIIALPNRMSYDARFYDKFWAAYDVPRHLYHFSPKDVEALALKNNLKVYATLPMIFDSFYVSLLSEKYKGRSNPFRAFFIGLLSNLKANGNGKTFSSQIYILKRK